MKRASVISGVIVVIILQLCVLASVYFGAVYPLWTGREIKLKTVPVDPRSMFRGNYAQLRYDISAIDRDGIDTEGLRSGEVVYVSLKPSADGIYEFDGAGLEKPSEGVFIRGRIRERWGKQLGVMYGIEAYFAPKEKALALEKELRDGGIAVVMISDSGKAALKEIIAE